MEVNKGIAAVLVAGIVFFLTGLIGDILVRERLPEKPVLNIAAAPAATGGGAAKPEPLPPIAPLLAIGRSGGGRSDRQEGLRRLPHLQQGRQAGRRAQPVWRGRRAARSHGRLQLLHRAEGQAGPWTFDELNEWLHKPSAYAPGTRMAFAGITSDKQRADVIAYLRTLSDNPRAAAVARGSAARRRAAPAAPARRRQP